MSRTAKSNRIGKNVLGAFAFLLTFIVILLIVVYCLCAMACSDKRPYAQKTFVTTLLETGELKFVVKLFLNEDKINEIVDSNSMEDLEAEVDESLITIKPREVVIREEVYEVNAGSITDNKEMTAKENKTEDPDGDGVDVFEVIGRSFSGKMMVVYDPSKVFVSAKYPFGKTGQTLDKFVEKEKALGAINGGLYEESGNSGGTPYGVVVSNGEILRNKPREEKGLVLIGLTEEGVLIVENISEMTEGQVKALVEKKKIRDAVCFQEEASDKNNHFVQLIINGEKREMKGMGSGLNPRTVIGQRADGALLLLVTDGRGASGHLGASASDLIDVMSEYGAVNAANLDGGSSSCMYYNGEYLMNSVTFYYANSSWNLPLAWVVK